MYILVLGTYNEIFMKFISKCILYIRIDEDYIVEIKKCFLKYNYFSYILSQVLPNHFLFYKLFCDTPSRYNDHSSF